MPDITSSADALKKQEDAAGKRAAEISTRIRNSIRAALPTAPEQFLTIMVPGKVINPEDYMTGFNKETGETETILLPLVTELNQAILCDDCPTLSAIQMGPTGKSVARSYASALQKLAPVGTPVGIVTNDESKLTQDEKNYIYAMNWLNGEDPDSPGKSRVDVYVEKQKAYTKTVEDKQAAFAKALKEAQDDPRNKNKDDQRAAYDQWVNVHARTYRNYMQAAYMDWVITGKKEAVEYWFAMVDMDTAMARVEQSKECMRAATVMDSDGSAEYQKVKLDPSYWAWLAYKKAQPDSQSNLKTAEWYTFEINRLTRLNRVLEAAKASENIFEATNNAAQENETGTDPVAMATKEYLKAKKEYEEKSRAKSIASKDKTGDAGAGSTPGTKDERASALDNLDTKRKAMQEAMAQQDRNNISRLNRQGQEAQSAKFKTLMEEVGKKVKDNDDLIKSYEDARALLMNQRADDATSLLAKEFEIPDALPDPVLVSQEKQQYTGSKRINPNDYWTAVSVEIAASYEGTEMKEQSSSTSVGASYSLGIPGPFSASVNASHSQSSVDASAQMASSDVKISFECMRVDINRSWLRGELFYDSDLTSTADLSAGALKMKSWMDPANCPINGVIASIEECEQQLQRYGTFPMYPTAFILAANVTLEISGETSSIQSHFGTSATSASGSVGYGPFSVDASHAQSEKTSSTKCETTASGCRITMKAPQIIGWVSQILPALPRLPNRLIA